MARRSIFHLQTSSYTPALSALFLHFPHTGIDLPKASQVERLLAFVRRLPHEPRRHRSIAHSAPSLPQIETLSGTQLVDHLRHPSSAPP